ncbi:MAG: hypothetical protein HY544_04230 [Candidatus Diapherotrites archaeon]|uniref:Ribonuclease P protein component 2 n=1 Tax=Candidatus Iainarchaeum sp. TaxID=3101447 RepID=A0A8T3YKW2_9ARCH|nr:hypothetical protein [Candidatus Diapherotrites archaeon]
MMPSGKKSLNPIPPTLRGKKRYVKFRLVCGAKLAEKDAWPAVSGVFSGLFGSSGMGLQRLWLLKWFQDSNEGIIRCALREEENVKAGILFLRRVGQQDVIPMIVKVSGSVRKLKGSY